jgi:hypothetical protein
VYELNEGLVNWAYRLTSNTPLAGNTTRLGLFDRPADDKALRSLLNPPAIPDLTESLINGVEPGEVADAPFPIKEGRLLAVEDPDHHRLALWSRLTKPSVASGRPRQTRSLKGM